MRHLLCASLLLAAAADAGALNGNGSRANGTNGSPAGWPGVWGPHRNGTAAGPGLPSGALAFKELWRRPTQGGYSEVIVTPRGAYTMEARGGTDDVIAMEAETGRERWRVRLGPTYRGHTGSHDGPIATPAVEGSDLFAVSPRGLLVALDTATGRERWRHDLVQAYGASPMIYGFGSSPLVDGSLVLVQTGGEKSRGLLAFDRADGTLRWHARHGLRGSYSSPAIGTLAGRRQVIASAGDLVYAVSPADGSLLWSIKGPGSGESVANPPQVLSDDRVLITFWGEAVLLKITRQGDSLTATELWRSPRLRGAYSPTIQRGEQLYGFNGPFLSCVDLATGDVRWRHRMYEGTVVGVGQHLLVLGRMSGTLHVVAPSLDGFREVASTAVLTPGSTTMTGPSFAGNRIFVRNSEEIVALAVEGR